MNNWKIIITPDAEKDIYDIHNYIARTLLAPETAKKQVSRIIKGIHSLDYMPLRFPLHQKEPWNTKGLRNMPIDNFVVFYLPNPDKKETVILHIFYSGRNIENYLNESNFEH